jgi:hypothetical protein
MSGNEWRIACLDFLLTAGHDLFYIGLKIIKDKSPNRIPKENKQRYALEIGSGYRAITHTVTC